MAAVTWEPGTDSELDELFDYLREIQYNQNHRLSKNYGREAFAESVGLTIWFNDQQIPELCSSVAIRDCWPANTFRILNRAWKHESHTVGFPRFVSERFGESAISQIEFVKERYKSDMFFISRQTKQWDNWVIPDFKNRYGLDFKTDSFKYLTCPNECDDTCWQKIIYIGKKTVLKKWKRKE